jgi:hypothetical protein
MVPFTSGVLNSTEVWRSQMESLAKEMHKGYATDYARRAQLLAEMKQRKEEIEAEKRRN